MSKNIKLLNVIFHWIKELFFATFYGICQCTFQTICWVVFELLFNLFGILLWGRYEGNLRWCVYECCWGYTMMYYWISMFINKKKPLVKFVVPYILYAAITFHWVVIVHGVSIYFLFLALVIPFTCLSSFLLEDKMKRLLEPHRITYIVSKILCNIIGGIAMFIFTVFVSVLIADDIRGYYLQPSRKHFFDDAKKLSNEVNVEIPEYKVKRYKKGYTNEIGDYTDKMKLKFLETPTDESYNTLDSLSNIKDSNWQKLHDGTYFFYKEWERLCTCFPERTLSVSIARRNDKFNIKFCGWE